jgi:hypothetical protein
LIVEQNVTGTPRTIIRPCRRKQLNWSQPMLPPLPQAASPSGDLRRRVDHRLDTLRLAGRVRPGEVRAGERVAMPAHRLAGSARQHAALRRTADLRERGDATAADTLERRVRPTLERALPAGSAFVAHPCPERMREAPTPHYPA